MPAPRVLVVDDEPAVTIGVAGVLGTRGVEVRTSGDPEDAGRLALGFRPDLAVVGAGLAGEGADGLAGRLRAMGPVPLILLAPPGLRRRAARWADADDHVERPVAVEELVARIETRLGLVHASPAVRVGDLEIDEAGGWARRGERPLELTATELRLLARLADRPRVVRSKVDLLRAVWAYDGYDPNLVEVHVSALRRKLEAGGEPRVLHTVPRAGYCLRPAPAAAVTPCAA